MLAFLKTWSLPLLLLTGGFLAWLTGLADMFTLKTLQLNLHVWQAWVGQHPVLASVLYMGSYTLITVLALPVALFLSLAGGALFGLWWGFLAKMVGAMVGAILTFMWARGSMGKAFQAKYPRQIARIQKALEGNMFTSLLIMRLIPVFPFFLLNIAPGVIGMRMRDYTLATLLGIIPAGFVYTLAGVGLAEAIAAGEEASLGQVFTPTLMAALGGIVVLALLPKLVGWVRKLKKRENLC